MTPLCIIPDQNDITSMEAFRDAITNHKGLQTAYLDDLTEIYKDDPEQWHNAFMHYHDLIMDYGEVAIGLSSNGFWIDDLHFASMADDVPIKIIP